MKKVGKIILMVICGIALVTAVIFVLMSLWNWLVPELFNGPHINFWQAAGILVLSKILFGFGKGKGGHCRKCGGGRGPFGPGAMWKQKMREKWNEKMSHLSPEEKEKMKNKWQECWWGEEHHKSSETPKE